MGFSDEPAVAFAPDAARKLMKDMWRVKQKFSFTFPWKDKVAVVNVPAGYLTDGASVPRIFWGMIPPWGIYGAAAIVHDLLCEYLKILVDGELVKISRKEADQIFVLAMKELEVPQDKIDTIGRAVDGYREVFNVRDVNWQQAKAALEAEWAANNP